MAAPASGTSTSSPDAKGVLACLDFSEASPRVLARAVELASALEVRVWLLHVGAEEPALVGYDPDPVGTFTPEDRARQLLDEHDDLRRLAADALAMGTPVEPLLVLGPTVDTIISTAERLGVGWIVVGTHGRTGLRHLLLGSVSEGIIRRADSPVVVVPPDDRNGG